MRTTLLDLLSQGQPVVADGGMGTMLFAMGLERGSAPELWNVEHPDEVRSVHRGYIEAGAQIVLTNTFGGNAFRLIGHGLAERVGELNRAAAQLARQEADAAAQPVVVGGSMGPTGQMLEPLGDLTFEDAAAAFEAQAAALVEGGVDVLWIETMADLEEVHAAVEGARRAAPEMPIVTTMTFDTRGRTMMGVTPERAVETLSQYNVIALGANCGNGPDEIETVIGKMHQAGPEVHLIAKANAGLPHMEDGQAVYDASPEVMNAYAARVLAQGAQIVGACCGSTPDHIRAIAEALRV
ncbi:MAG TPA: betaine--homocysteine S-methyltransferase [Aggregatilinea sp.]|uniref:betaine--homocysteine S-methyltransferase n=1 Tax=Aggregatilinea sp. TaxID=2806333 RepID=UPI002C7349C1|nr:betaine--homocysteine S-methyltransferase [Aggregatilinea sp.]HML24516.1 betaine--homocysteine S-methyltransferase [Aggregatilinea sp.]